MTTEWRLKMRRITIEELIDLRAKCDPAAALQEAEHWIRLSQTKDQGDDWFNRELEEAKADIASDLLWLQDFDEYVAHLDRFKHLPANLYESKADIATDLLWLQDFDEYGGPLDQFEQFRANLYESEKQAICFRQAARILECDLGKYELVIPQDAKRIVAHISQEPRKFEELDLWESTCHPQYAGGCVADGEPGICPSPAGDGWRLDLHCHPGDGTLFVCWKRNENYGDRLIRRYHFMREYLEGEYWRHHWSNDDVAGRLKRMEGVLRERGLLDLADELWRRKEKQPELGSEDRKKRASFILSHLAQAYPQ